MSSEAARVPALDGLRGLAIALVVAHHATQFAGVPAAPGWEQTVHAFGMELWLGVDLFFVLSGYLITGILLRTRERAGYFKNFYVRRVLRIFPLYYLAVFLMCVVLPSVLHRGYTQELRSHQLWYWAYLPNFLIFRQGDWFVTVFDHTWSLAIEEQFYLVWPLLVWWLGPRRLVPATVLLALASIGCRLWLDAHGASDAQIRVLPFSHSDGLALGSLVAALESLDWAPAWLRRLGLGALALGLGLRLSELVPGAPAWWDDNEIRGTAWTMVAWGLLALLASRTSPWLDRLLVWRPLVFLGTYSYGLYLIHLPVMVWAAPYLARADARLHSGALGAAVLLLVSGGVSMAVAWLSYHQFEARFLRLKDRFV